MLDAQIDYWRDQLAGVEPVLELPTDRPRPGRADAARRHRARRVPPALRERLKAVSRDANATLFMTLLAAFAVLLARYTGARRRGGRLTDGGAARRRCWRT